MNGLKATERALLKVGTTELAIVRTLAWWAGWTTLRWRSRLTCEGW